MPEPDRLPRPWLLLAVAIGFCGLVGAALLGGNESVLGRFGASLSQLVVTLGFGFAGLSEAALRLRKRIQRNRTRDLAVLALERMETELGRLVGQVYGMLVDSIRDGHRDTPPDVAPAFRVPIEDVQATHWDRAKAFVHEQAGAFGLAARPLERELLELSKKKYEKSLQESKEKIKRVAESLGLDASTTTTTPEHGDLTQPAPEGDNDPGTSRQRYQQILSFDAGAPDPPLVAPASLVGHADRALPSLRRQSSNLAEASAQLGLLLSSDEAESLLEGTLRVRTEISAYGPSVRPRNLSDDPEEKRIELGLWQIESSRRAYEMATRSLTSAHALLGILDRVFDRRVGGCEGARQHVRIKRSLDARDDLEESERELRSLIDEVRDRTRQRHTGGGR
jgi:hypothetical protein